MLIFEILSISFILFIFNNLNENYKICLILIYIYNTKMNPNPNQQQNTSNPTKNIFGGTSGTLFGTLNKDTTA